MAGNFFPSLFGNEQTKERIGKAILSAKIPHAFLIGGAEGSGRLTLATELAAALLCKSDSGTLPCGACTVCRRIREGSHTDVKLLLRKEDKASIGVSEVKDFRQDMYLSPSEADKKVYIIKDADRLTPEAQNSLLIILEEPPKNVFIILLAASLDKILTTVRSRTQYIAMQRFTREEIDRYLKERSREAKSLSLTDPDKYAELLTLADGRIGRALSLLNGKELKASRGEREDAASLVRACASGVSYSELYKALLSMPKQRAELSAVFEDVMNALRDAMAVKHTEAAELLFFSTREEAIALSDAVKQRRIGKIFDLFTRAHEELSKNAGVQPLLTLLAAEIKTI